MSLLSVNKSIVNLIILIFFSFYSSLCLGQDDWIEYVSMKDKGAMSVSLDLSLDMARPNYKNMLIVGAKFSKCFGNGFPTEEGLEDIFAFSDSVAVAIDKITVNRLAGFMTYQCMGFDVFYVKDTIGLRDELTKTIRRNFPYSQPYIDMKRDKSWGYYRNYLYPNDFSAEFLIDQDYLHDLVLQGDDLKGLRKVNHWLYFKNVTKRNEFGKKMQKMKFSLDSIAYKKDRELPYELIISRKDSIDPLSINRLTSLLRGLSGSMNGQYDGWSTKVIPKE